MNSALVEIVYESVKSVSQLDSWLDGRSVNHQSVRQRDQ